MHSIGGTGTGGDAAKRRVSRRQLLRIGGISTLGLTSMDLARLRARAAPGARQSNACVFVFLFGGPSHIDLWDMKPDAPAEIRGDFRPIATATPGIYVCEHLPRLARVTDKLCLIRSMTHQMPVHGPACSEMYTGRPYPGPPITDQAKPEDWPSVASLVARYGQKQRGWPPSVVLPWYTQFHGQDKPIAGQTEGRMGRNHRPFLIEGDPSLPDFSVPGLRLPDDVTHGRVETRHALLRTIETAIENGMLQGTPASTFHDNYAIALSMLGNPRAAEALDLQREPRAARERYGPSKFAQSLLLARRLVEAGISLVTVNWHDESAEAKISPFWDTHDSNFASLKDRLAPRFDRAFATFLDDLAERGLLETTLVVATGEFGRTPRIGQRVQNAMTQKTGRDHWPHAFTVLLAGGGVRGGQVHGATDRFGAYVKDDPVSPADLSATILYHLGIDREREYWDEFQQVPRRLSEGSPLRGLG